MQDSVAFGLKFTDKRTESLVRSVLNKGTIGTGCIKEVETVVVIPSVGKTGRAVFAHHINDVIRVGKRADSRFIKGFLHTFVGKGDTDCHRRNLTAKQLGIRRKCAEIVVTGQNAGTVKLEYFFAVRRAFADIGKRLNRVDSREIAAHIGKQLRHFGTLDSTFKIFVTAILQEAVCDCIVDILCVPFAVCVGNGLAVQVFVDTSGNGNALRNGERAVRTECGSAVALHDAVFVSILDAGSVPFGLRYVGKHTVCVVFAFGKICMDAHRKGQRSSKSGGKA